MLSLYASIILSAPASSYKDDPATGIKLINPLQIFPINSYPEGKKRKAILLSSLEKEGATKSEIAIGMAMAMQESTAYNAHDADKKGDSANFGLFNMNKHLISTIAPEYTEDSLMALNDYTNTEKATFAISSSVKIALSALRKDSGELELYFENNTPKKFPWHKINSALNFNRAGDGGFASTGNPDCPKMYNSVKTSQCLDYRSAIASMANMILKDPSLLTGDTRIDSPLVYLP